MNDDDEVLKRNYINDSNEVNGEASFFVGTEVERTAQYEQQTLFVVGVQEPSEIMQWAEKVDARHIYLGANKSFHMVDEWEHIVDELLSEGYWVTLDYPVRFHNFIMRSMGNHMRSSRFIPMISVELPNIEIYNYNTTIKLDDLDIDHSNPGVWCHQLHDLMTRETFTDWDNYVDDEVLK